MACNPTLFHEHYRIPSVRLAGWDYAGYASYFVTICTKGRVPWFGDMCDGRMVLSDIGRIVDDEWRKTGIIRSYVHIDTYVIMPDHMHGIITIAGGNNDSIGVETSRRDVSTVPGSTFPPASVLSPGSLPPPASRLIPNSLGSIINQFKSVATKRIRASGHPDFTWQPRFHDHIIRSGDAMESIREYIRMNPKRWGMKR